MASVTVAGGRQVFHGMGEDAEEWQGKWRSLLRCENGIMSQAAKAKWRWTRALLTYEWGEQASQARSSLEACKMKGARHW